MDNIKINKTIMALYYGNRSPDEIQQVLQLLNPHDDFHSLKVLFLIRIPFNIIF